MMVNPEKGQRPVQDRQKEGTAVDPSDRGLVDLRQSDFWGPKNQVHLVPFDHQIVWNGHQLKAEKEPSTKDGNQMK